MSATSHDPDARKHAESLNVAVAAGIFLYHFSPNKSKGTPQGVSTAPGGSRSGLQQKLHDQNQTEKTFIYSQIT